MAEFGKYAATAKPYIIKNGEKILKVAEPYYCHEKKSNKSILSALWNRG